MIVSGILSHKMGRGLCVGERTRTIVPAGSCQKCERALSDEQRFERECFSRDELEIFS